MQPIKSRKHAPSRFNQHVSAALATMLLPLAAGAADAPQVHDDAASAPVSKVEVVGKTENDFKAERAASPKYTEKLVDTAQSVQVIKKELI